MPAERSCRTFRQSTVGTGARTGGTSSAVSVVEGRMPLAGGAIAYTKAGTGPAVLLIHGLEGTRRTWWHLITPLAPTHAVISPDLPGHGLSDPPAGDYSLGAHACAMRDLLLTLGHHRATIVGHSLGGGVALQTAYQFPERTERVVLISSGGLGAEVTPILRAATLPGADPVVAGPGRLDRRETLDGSVALITATESWPWWALELDGGSVTYDRDSLIMVGNDAEFLCGRGWPGMPGGSRGPSHTFEQGAHTLYQRLEDRPDLPGNWYRWG
jgi:pimeloyl-ACP methyl ester carboxylesterase